MAQDQGLITVDKNKNIVGYTTSPAIYMYNHYAVNIQAIFTGTFSATLQLQTSLDYQPGGPNGGPAPVTGTWVNYPSSSQDIVSGASCAWDIFGTGARWIRVSVTNIVGTGTLSKLLAQVKG